VGGERAEQTRLLSLDDAGATFAAVCYEHGEYELCIDPIDGGYLDLATLYRGDWAFGCQLVDGALLALGTPPADMPARIFTPLVLSGSGGKLSKSLLRAAPDSPALAGQRPAGRPEALLPILYHHRVRNPHGTTTR
jgi:hypothetical protein